VNIEKPTTKETEYLAQNYPFHQLDLDDCLSRIQRPKIDNYPGYLFIVLHFPLFSKGARVTIPSQVSIFIGKDYLVTSHAGILKPLVKLFKDCQSNEETRQELMGNDSGYLFYHIMDRLVDYCFPMLDKILGNIEGIEDITFDERVDAAHDVSILRRDIATQRRIIGSVRNIMMDLERQVQRFTKMDLSIYFGDINDHLNHLWNTLEEAKERVEIFQDADYILGQDRLQTIMTILTIITAIMLPFSIISSIYGMNVPLPGSGAQGHDWIGWVLISIMVVIAGVMLFFFRRRRWI
jgi:magnesium transporter